VPSCSFYQYDLNAKAITARRIYFDFATLMRQSALDRGAARADANPEDKAGPRCVSLLRKPSCVSVKGDDDTL
jgi:hypothetical protein